MEKIWEYCVAWPYFSYKEVIILVPDEHPSIDSIIIWFIAIFVLNSRVSDDNCSGQ
jgi:hypothetical protein